MLSRSFVTNARSRALKIAIRTFLLAGWAAYLGGVAHAQDAALDISAPNCEVAAAPTTDPPTIASSVSALDDFKKALLARGYNLQLNYIGDGLGNTTGGVKQGAVYEGILYMVLDADLAKIARLDGLSFRISAYQIHGGQLSASNVFNLATVDSIEARPTTRLFELWVEQSFGGLVSLRIGQLAADNQFFISEFGNNLYINSTFGWPTCRAEEDLTTRWLLRAFASKLIRTITSLFSPACTMAIPPEQGLRDCRRSRTQPE